MEFNLDILEPRERTVLALRTLYEREGYRKYSMGRFEEYGLYQENRRFLPSGQIITFTDLDGRLLALKPDVTLSIAKNARAAAGGCERYYYCENVYRPGSEGRAFEEIEQMGLECIGEACEAAACEVAMLAVESLALIGEKPVLALSHMGFIAGALEEAGIPRERRTEALAFLREKNAHGLRALAEREGLKDSAAQMLSSLVSLSGTGEEIKERAAGLVQNSDTRAALGELTAICERLGDAPGSVVIDFSVVNDIDYYNGLVFRGYLAGLPRAVLKGGRYDPLADKFSKGARAIGFALYLDELRRLDASAESSAEQPLNIALPKGRLGSEVCELLESAGCAVRWNDADSRRLVLENENAAIRCFLVKPCDVAAYVAHGAADVGIVGLDVLKESGADVYELLDTGLGACRMCVAAPVGFKDERGGLLRVATKYPALAKEYYAARGREIDIIGLGGSIELAPILGLADVIVDIVQTGATLKDNGLEVCAEFMPVSARLIANKASYRFKREAITALAEKLSEVRDDKNS